VAENIMASATYRSDIEIFMENLFFLGSGWVKIAAIPVWSVKQTIHEGERPGNRSGNSAV
jgi:hypothetical protein